MRTFIVEHPTRGTLLYTSEIGAPRFSRTNSRTDQRNWHFFTAQAALDVMREYVVPEKVRAACEIRRSPDWVVVWPKQ